MAEQSKKRDGDEKGYYDLAEAITGLKRGTLQAKVSRGEIPHFRLGKRLVIFSRSELLAWMDQRQVPEARRTPDPGAPSAGTQKS